MSVVVYLLAALLLVAVLSPAALSLRGRRFDAFEVIHWFGFTYFLHFGVGSLTAPLDLSYAEWSAYIPRATFFALLGYIALLVGYLVPPFRPRQLVAERPRSVWVVVIPALTGGTGYIIWAQVEAGHVAVTGFNSLLGQLAPLFLFAWALTWLSFWESRGVGLAGWVLRGAMLGAALVIAPMHIADKTVPVSLLLIPMMAYWYARGRLPWRSLSVLALVVVFVLFPLCNTFRWERLRNPELTSKDHLSLTVKTISEWKLETYLHQSIGTVQRRMLLVESFAVILRDVDEKHPYLHGEEWALAPGILFVPRLFWPEKPRLDNDFGQRFGIVGPEVNTHIATSVPGELYWNFGLPAVLLGMLALGAALRGAYWCWGESRSLSTVHCALYLTIWGPLVMLESNLAYTLTGVLKTVLVISVLMWGFRRLGALERA